MQTPRTACIVAALLLPPTAGGIEVETAIVTRDGDAYEVAIDARLSPPPAGMLAVLTDYARLPELHGRIRESRVLGEPQPGTMEVFTRFDGCFMLVCRSLERVELIRRTPAGLEAEDVPGRSAFREGRTRWLLAADGSGTRLAYRARLVPRFWVPPVFGPMFLARAVKEMTLETLAAAEARAAQQHPLTEPRILRMPAPEP